MSCALMPSSFRPYKHMQARVHSTARPSTHRLALAPRPLTHPSPCCQALYLCPKYLSQLLRRDEAVTVKVVLHEGSLHAILSLELALVDGGSQELLR